jgi:hypothetical protein
MNKDLIEKLAEQAFFETEYDDAQNLPETMHKFAELIVKDCTDIVNNQGPFLRYNMLTNAIQKHFGIKK